MLKTLSPNLSALSLPYALSGTVPTAPYPSVLAIDSLKTMRVSICHPVARPHLLRTRPSSRANALSSARWSVPSPMSFLPPFFAVNVSSFQPCIAPLPPFFRSEQMIQLLPHLYLLFFFSYIGFISTHIQSHNSRFFFFFPFFFIAGILLCMLTPFFFFLLSATPVSIHVCFYSLSPRYLTQLRYPLTIVPGRLLAP